MPSKPRPRHTRQWLQLNIELARQKESALLSARFLLRELESMQSQPGHDVDGFFFQRKPPDLRLRFFGQRERLIERLRPLIKRAKSEGHVLRCFSSTYEPEWRLFGGPECMKAVHAFWATDSLLWIAQDRIVENGGPGNPQGLLMESALNDLFWRVLADGAEVWDTWCNLAALVQAETKGEQSAQVPPPLCRPGNTAISSQDEILARYQHANARLAAELAQVWQAGRMMCGVRSVLPYVALFTLNRHGYDQASVAALAASMVASWDPRRQLRGASRDPVGRTGSLAHTSPSTAAG